MTESQLWRALTDPPMICDDRVRKQYDATTGKRFPVLWEPVKRVNREAALPNEENL